MTTGIPKAGCIVGEQRTVNIATASSQGSSWSSLYLQTKGDCSLKGQNKPAWTARAASCVPAHHLRGMALGQKLISCLGFGRAGGRKVVNYNEAQ